MLKVMWYSLKESSASWILIYVALAIVGFLCALVMHKLLTRLKECYFKNSNINLWVPSIVLGVLVIPYRLPFSIIIIHFSVIYLIVDVIAWAFKKTTGKESKFVYSGVLSLIISTIVCTYGILNFIIVVPNQYIRE